MEQDTVSCIDSGGVGDLVSAYQVYLRLVARGSWLVACGLWLFGYSFLFFRGSIYQYCASTEDGIHSIAMLPEFVEQHTSTCTFSNGVKTALPTPLYSVVVPR